MKWKTSIDRWNIWNKRKTSRGGVAAAPAKGIILPIHILWPRLFPIYDGGNAGKWTPIEYCGLMAKWPTVGRRGTVARLQVRMERE